MKKARARSRSDYLRKESPPEFEVGDTVKVGVIITETVEKRGKLEEKQRTQIFIGCGDRPRAGSGIERVRSPCAASWPSEGVERTFPVHSPKIAGVKVKRKVRVRRAKLYYLRDRSGKSARLKERIVSYLRKKG